MKKKNIKGFTLLELVVAIAIFTIVMFIGYKIINQTTKSIKDQGNINKGQLTMNNMNTYLTKDLEQATDIKINILKEDVTDLKENKSNSENILIKLNNEYKKFINSNNKSIQYIYTINTENDIKESRMDDKKVISKYITVVNNIQGVYKYTIGRIGHDNVKVDFITNQVLRDWEHPPFTINNTNPYEVTMSYNGKNNRTINHKIDVASRYNMIDSDSSTGEESGKPWEPIIPIPKPPKPEEIPPPPNIDEYSAIGFWTADKSVCIKNNLYTWVSHGSSNTIGEYATQDSRIEDEFEIELDNEEGNNGKVDSSIGYKNNNTDFTEAELEDISIHSANDIKQMMIYISPNTTLDKLFFEFKSGTFDGIGVMDTTKEITESLESQSSDKHGPYTLEGGDKGKFYKIKFTPSDNKKWNFEIDGDLSIDKDNNKFKVSSGYAVVYILTE